MKRPFLYSLVIIAILMGLSACKSERNIATYEDLYKEQPVSILLVPVQDNAKRVLPKTSQDEVLNDELTATAHYMRQTLTVPLVSQGYYTIAPLASDIIVQQIGKTFRQLSLESLTDLHSLYGIDAVLLVSIHKWKQPEVNEIVVFAEYTLRSTKSGLELMHTWVRGNKIQPVDAKGEPVELTTDIDFMQQNKVDSRLAHRCLLLQQMSDFVLRSLPTSVSRWHFKHDRFIPSNPAYYNLTINPDGSIERSTYSEDAFGNECFTD